MKRIVTLYRYMKADSIKVKLMRLFLVFSLLPLVVVGYFSYSTASNALQAHVEEKLLRISMNKLDTIDRILRERVEDIRIWSTLELAKAAIQTGSGIGGASDFVNFLAQQYRIYRLLLLLDADGACIVVNTMNHRHEQLPTNKLFLGRNFGRESWFEEAIQGDDVLVSDWHRVHLLELLAAETDEPQASTYSMVFASAIRDFDGTTLGIWVNVIEWEYIQDILEQIPSETPGSHSAANLLLLSDNDTIIAYSGNLSENETSLYGKSLSADLRHPQLAAMLAGHEAGIFSYAWDGIPKTLILSREQGFEQYFGKKWGYLMMADHASTYAQISTLRSRILLFGVFLTGIILIFAYITGDRVASPLSLLSESAMAIANGDLRRRIPVSDSSDGLTSRNEVTILLHSFHQMTGNLQRLLRQIKTASNQVTDASLHMSAALHQLSSLATQQSSAIVETTASIEEMTMTSREIANSADTVATFAEITEKEAHTGVQAAIDTLVRIQAIKQANDENMRHVMTLRTRSNEIHEIVDVITTIADTTDLIAFNAALEASSAGEKGTRFGVVADEIRGLANTVATSVEHIKQKTAEMQRGIQTLVTSFEQETDRIEHGVADMRVTTTALESILGKIEKTTASLIQISTATKQQQTSNEQIMSVLHEVSQEILQFQNITQQTLEIITRLHGLAEELQQTVHVFQTEQ